MKKNNIQKIGFVAASVVSSLCMFGVVFAAGPATVNLLSAGNFAVLTQTGITTTGPTSIVGDIGVSPIAATAMTGFGLIYTPGSTFAKSSLVVGKVYSPNYAIPTPTIMTSAIADMGTAYTNAVGRLNPTATELGVGNIGGMTITPGLYKWSSVVSITKDVTLKGSATDVWIFQIAQTLNVSPAVKILLSGGAQPKNIFWIVAGQTTIGTTAVFNGIILDKTGIALNTGATLNGRALAQTAVTLDSNMITQPAASLAMCDYAAPLAGCKYVDGPAYNSANQCGMILSCSTSTSSQASLAWQQVRGIKIDLVRGNTGSNVKILQNFLIAENKGASSLALAKAGANSSFGALTQKALIEFQIKEGINPVTGAFNAVTRTFLVARNQ